MEGYSDTCDVLVVGGGVSGLVSALTLIQHDSNLAVTLLEATDMLGGRAARGFGWGVGPLFQQLAGKDLSLHSNEGQSRTAMQLQAVTGGDRGNLRFFEPHEIPRLGGWRGRGLVKTLEKIDQLVLDLENLERHNRTPSVKEIIEMDSTTVFTWLEANTSDSEVKGVFVSLLRVLLGAELGQVFFIKSV